ncbi:Glycosyltransferase involved in cell wall bisynthesis [Paucidesulfovibrio gracilis DSM 16080]|uniref:Glycosyltransferase involved in cell wall bisynthesis n=1 Tax=Paucidesulfovibrio gracilis DSM 16080 TaxID=1121449 RepID=A0A1T4WZ69_9BACT|nr:glycosyltransferase family 4 protein [Paucidesulfovibrio gracilis]SKA82549.1 Glycosyltransferase involved in cell wall bisynthesis [Paucidesulfovibrio gracilis DSM 16080]
MTIQRLVFAKKFILPSRAANALQSLTMAYAFAANGVRTTLLPGFRARDRRAFQTELERGYALRPTPDLDLTALGGGHKGIYGLHFRVGLARRCLTADAHTVLYSRDIKEALFLARLKRRLRLRIPFFFEMHEILSEQHRLLDTGRADRYETMERELLRELDGIVVISPVLRDDLQRVYAPDLPVFVSPMGYNDAIFSPMPDVDLSGEVRCAYAGSLYPGKGIHNLVQAMAHLPDRFRLLVLGGNPGHELERLREMARNVPNGAERVRFAGHRSPLELAADLRNCHIFVVPQSSGAEFFSPIKLYEAMGLAIPTVATPVPAITGVLRHGETALLARDESPEALARTIRELATNPALAHALQKRCRTSHQARSWTQRAGDCLAFMNESIG